MSKTIMIVDDEERMRSLLKAYFKREGYNILEAENGIECMRIFNSKKVHLIILDVMMPVMDGWSVCNEIRKSSTIPIIMLTAKSEEDDKLLGYDLGIDDYVSKPFSPKVLVAKVKALIKRTYEDKSMKNNNYNYEGLCINEESHEVTIEGKEIYLSPKEFELLGYFTLNKGIVLSREQILNGVWGMSYFGDMRTVDTHIKRLREKLGEKAYLIITVRGIGYKFGGINEN